MDISVRFLNVIAGEAVTRYFDSRFFKRPNADNILEKILKATTNLPTKSLSMLLWMDQMQIGQYKQLLWTSCHPWRFPV